MNSFTEPKIPKFHWFSEISFDVRIPDKFGVRVHHARMFSRGRDSNNFVPACSCIAAEKKKKGIASIKESLNKADERLQNVCEFLNFRNRISESKKIHFFFFFLLGSARRFRTNQPVNSENDERRGAL